MDGCSQSTTTKSFPCCCIDTSLADDLPLTFLARPARFCTTVFMSCCNRRCCFFCLCYFLDVYLTGLYGIDNDVGGTARNGPDTRHDPIRTAAVSLIYKIVAAVAAADAAGDVPVSTAVLLLPAASAAVVLRLCQWHHEV